MGSHLTPVASSMLILAALVTSGLGQEPVLNGEDPGRRAESHCIGACSACSLLKCHRFVHTCEGS